MTTNVQSEWKKPIRCEQDSAIISFTTREHENDGFYALLISKIPVKSAGQHKYITNSNGLNLLKSKGIKYEIIN